MTADSDPNRERPLSDALAHLSFVVMAMLTKLAAENDVSLTQLRMLGILRGGRRTIGELADALGLDRSTVSGLVDRTERRGLVERSPHPVDGRSVLVSLSPDGVEASTRGTDQLVALLMPLTDVLTRAESRRLTTLLDAMLTRSQADRLASAQQLDTVGAVR